MAVGDQVLGGTHGAASNATLDIQPGSSIEWLITTIGSTAAAAMEVYYAADGTNFVLVDSYTGGSIHALQWRLTNSVKLRLKNTSGGTADIFFGGVITK